MMAGGEEFKRCLVDRTDRTTLLIGHADKRILQTVREKQGNIYIYIYTHVYVYIYRLPRCASGKEPTRQCRRHKTCGFDPWVRKISWRRA